MIGSQAADNPRAAQLETDFPSWCVWISDTGNWWASLRRQLTYEEIEADCVHGTGALPLIADIEQQ